jgi:hypothetical protein
MNLCNPVSHHYCDWDLNTISYWSDKICNG